MSNKILFIGYGNPGRQDDGLGPNFIDAFEGSARLNNEIALSSNYQLTVEDAYDISSYSIVVFVDASLDASEPFSFQQAQANDKHSLSSHQLQPESVLQLCQTLYNTQPEAYILAIRGYEFDEFQESLSKQARANLDKALRFAKEWIEQHA
jgi:hydrogenase maturation protease